MDPRTASQDSSQPVASGFWYGWSAPDRACGATVSPAVGLHADEDATHGASIIA